MEKILNMEVLLLLLVVVLVPILYLGILFMYSFFKGFSKINND